MWENHPVNGIANVMQAIASRDIEINKVRLQHSKLLGGKLRESLVLVRHRRRHGLWPYLSALESVSLPGQRRKKSTVGAAAVSPKN